MIPLLGATIVDVTVVLALALAAVLVLRRRSAALRHAILGAAIAAALSVPAVEQSVPVFLVELPWAESQITASPLQWAPAPPAATIEVEPSPSAEPPLRVRDVALLAWALGAIVVLAGLITGIIRLRLVTRRCRVIESGPWRERASDLSRRAGLPRPVTLLQSDDASLLLTWGLLRPRILLPAGADTWSDDRREVVLAHEIAHIRRHDWAWQMAAEGLRALHWFNPLAWIACRRLRNESEYACDDAVLEAGVEATEYASHLLEVARHATGHGAWASAPAVANPSTLERRISAMLTRQRNRTALTRRAGVLAAMCAIVVTIPVAAVSVTGRAASTMPRVAAGLDVALAPPTAPSRPNVAAPVPTGAPAPAAAATPARVAQQTPATFFGTVIDPSGGVLPGVEMSLTDTDVGVRYTAVTDGAGSFSFRELQPARYELVASLPGFAPVSTVFRLDAGARLERRLSLPLGTLQESIRVVCSSGAAALEATERLVAFGARGETSVLGTRIGTAWNRLAPPPAPPFAPQDTPVAKPIRVGGQIKAPSKIKNVNPICPRTVLPAGDTVVILVGTIGVDGLMNELALAGPKTGTAAPAPEFVESALEAARQWAFTPTLLNNVAVPVRLTITVLYQR
jgi:beta-lactamase regulating signal transducer with metallopeptidase domain